MRRKLFGLSALMVLPVLLISLYSKEYKKQAPKTKFEENIVKTPQSTSRVIDKALIPTLQGCFFNI